MVYYPGRHCENLSEAGGKNVLNNRVNGQWTMKINQNYIRNLNNHYLLLNYDNARC